MKKSVKFFYDLVSPYSYLAAVQIEELEQRTECCVVWEPLYLTGLMRLTGNQPPQVLEARRRYFFEQDLSRMACYLQVPYQKPESFPIQSAQVMRALLALDNERKAEKSLLLYEMHWGEGYNISDEMLLREVLGDEAVDFSSTEQAKQLLKQQTGLAAELGAFGAPTFFVDNAMFFGCDRISLLEYFLQSENE
ncbi:2-hydroxychromene-2-carboxylate isomerase [Oceanospirillum sediminis]|uniref:2-hydroxychromene-2-carboxylate isomerase n=1 Tax=Oceanospirillum sediminis TaxID=2760088 RepID=A0A839IRY5_9GAMM|nr:2-hydroxychromene-2-carboxylate isomerase [Oceanospirillum sediminis]MBB1487430.1 2-hydroxychromene-2-carboxylate isomerase [Oceanospirillum sediminis]